jgi:tetratricopeptide (TPR) repeat protein
MPSIEAVDRIKNVVNSLGNEEAILQEKGVAIEDVLPPEQGVDDDLQNLLASGPEIDEMTTMDSLISSLEEDEPVEEDFGLDSLDESFLSEDPDDDLSLMDESPPEQDILSDDIESLELPNDIADMTDDMEAELEDLPPLDEVEPEPTSPEEFAALADTGDLDSLEDLGEMEGLEGLDDLGEMDDLDSLEDLDISDMSLGAEETGDIPDMSSAMDDLADSLDIESPMGQDNEEIILDEDFGLNEIDDDFLDDLNESDDDQFSLDDLGEEYNFTEDDTDLSTELGLDLDELEKDIDQTVDDESAQTFELTQDELEKLEAALYGLPLNLKIAVQDFFSDESSTVDQLNKMTNLIVTGVAPKNIASTYKKYTGKKINIPRGYEKKSGNDFARERASLITFIKEKVIPRITLALGAFFSLWVIFLILFNFVYRPLKAENLYMLGEEEIALDNYAKGEEYFNSAFFGWDIGPLQVEGVRRQQKFFNYAKEYVNRKNYLGAEEKYQQLLQAYPANEKGRIAYGELLRDKLVRYQDAEYILKGADPLMLAEAASGDLSYESIPLKEITEINNIERLIALGDNYLLWAEDEPSKYENARYIYATLLKDKAGGNSDEVLLRMLRYQIRRDNAEEIDLLRQVYKDREKVNADPTLQAHIFSELAGWLIDNDRVLESRDFILKAEGADKTVPDSHYQYARFFHETYNPQDEKEALTNALGYLDREEELDKKHIFMQIDSYRRLGNLSLYVGDYNKAERQFLMGLEIFENSHRLNLIGTSPEIGALYGELGNLNYDQYKDYDKALEYYEMARNNLGETPDIDYREGFIHYSIKKNYSQALLELYTVSRYYPENRNLLLAMGNTLLERGDYYGAVSHYEQLLDQLKEQEDNIKVLLPDEKEEEWALLEYLIMAHNNLGIARNGVAQKTPNRFMEKQALASFTASSEYFDKLLRNRSTFNRTDLKDRAGENRQAILTANALPELQLYDEILPHLNDLPAFYRDQLAE